MNTQSNQRVKFWSRETSVFTQFAMVLLMLSGVSFLINDVYSLIQYGVISLFGYGVIFLIFASIILQLVGRRNLGFLIGILATLTHLAEAFSMGIWSIFSVDWSFVRSSEMIPVFWFGIIALVALPVSSVFLVLGRPEWRSIKGKRNLEQEGVQAKSGQQHRQRAKANSQKRPGLLADTKKAWAIAISAIVGVGVIFGFSAINGDSTSWSNLAKQCDSLMTDYTERSSDSYSVSEADDELRLFTLYPRGSQWLDCLGRNLSTGAPNVALGEFISKKTDHGQSHNFEYGNLFIRLENLNQLALQLRISRQN